MSSQSHQLGILYTQMSSSDMRPLDTNDNWTLVSQSVKDKGSTLNLVCTLIVATHLFSKRIYWPTSSLSCCETMIEFVRPVKCFKFDYMSVRPKTQLGIFICKPTGMHKLFVRGGIQNDTVQITVLRRWLVKWRISDKTIQWSWQILEKNMSIRKSGATVELNTLSVPSFLCCGNWFIKWWTQNQWISNAIWSCIVMKTDTP